MSVLRARGVLQSSSSTESTGTTPDEFAVLYPGIWEMLTAPLMPDGKTAREGALLMVFCQDGVVKCCLSDRDTDSQAWVSAKGVDALFSSLESGLQLDSLEWREIPAKYRKKKR
jgi:hypothetical protein